MHIEYADLLHLVLPFSKEQQQAKPLSIQHG